jgi:hypothetical protein
MGATMDRGASAQRISPSIIWVGGRYGQICKDCVRRGTRDCRPECQPPDFRLFEPWYKKCSRS